MVQTKSFELTGFQRDLLYVIAGSDQPSGQTVRQQLETHIDNVNHGRLYPNLDTLVDHELVKKGSQDQRTNYYERHQVANNCLHVDVNGKISTSLSPYFRPTGVRSAVASEFVVRLTRKPPISLAGYFSHSVLSGETLFSEPFWLPYSSSLLQFHAWFKHYFLIS